MNQSLLRAVRVMNTPNQINQAYINDELQKMGVPWDCKMSDSQWQENIKVFPSIYHHQRV